jgi:metal-sulfur cluster biosynthetic enzyme
MIRLADSDVEAEAWDRLGLVYDPELGVNLVDLGLVYELTCCDGDVRVRMTLTTPGCPVSDSMPVAVERALETVPGVRAIAVELVWDPPWEPEMMSCRARQELGWR